MRNFARRTVAATVGAIALGCAGIVSAVAADVAQQPPTAYGYPPAPVYGYYAPPRVVVVPPPFYYGRPYYGGGYGYPAYGFRRHAPYFARGYGHHGRYYR
jgi:hypothetical protein